MTASILIVEDHELNLELLREIVEIEGMTADYARSGAELRTRLAQPPPAVVLLDLVLPDATGAQLLAELRATPGWRDVPVIAITAQVLPPDLQPLASLGFAVVVTKPFDTRRLGGLLRSYVVTSPGTSPAAAPEPESGSTGSTRSAGRPATSP